MLKSLKSEAEKNLVYYLLNNYQRDFPLVSQPFLAIANQFNTTEEHVMKCYQNLQDSKFVSRIGPVFRPKRFGVSTLAAVHAEVGKIDEIANFINGFSEVNHNYERENELNLWFVVTAKTEEDLQKVLKSIEDFAKSKVHDLRLEEEFHIDLGFSLEKPLEKS